MRHRYPLTAASGRPSGPAGWPLYVLCIASFGPYVLPAYGITTTQIALYPLATWAIWRLVSTAVPKRLRPLMQTTALLLSMVLWTILTTVFAKQPAPALALAAQLDAYAQPTLVFLITAATSLSCCHDGSIAILRNCTILLVTLLTANTCIALWTALTSTYPAGLLGHWTRAHLVEESLMARAAIGMGRYAGVFPTPATAGIAYSLGLLLGVYWMKRDTKPVLGSLTAMLMILGGGLAKSKSFYIGVVLASTYLFVGPRKERSLVALGATAAALFVLSGPLGLSDWAFHRGIADKLVVPEGDLVSSLSAGRYGEGNVTVSNLEQWIVASPWTGHGLTNAQFGALDSEVLAHLTAGGTPALGLYVAVIALIISTGVGAIRCGSPDGWLTLFMGLLLVLEGLGRPVLGANMAGPLVALVLALSLTQPIPDAPARAGSGQLHPIADRAASRSGTQ